MFWKKAKQKNDNLSVLKKLNGKEIKYVTERSSRDYGEIVIGKEGAIHIHEGDLILLCGNEIIFRHPLEGIEGGEFMSCDGINLRYTDSNGEARTIVVYYKHYNNA